MWRIITENKKEHSKHPETLRWNGKLKAMYLRHELLVNEMNFSEYYHKSPLDKRKATGKSNQDVFIDDPLKQITILKNKKYDCKI
jgi:hypothetical protein